MCTEYRNQVKNVHTALQGKKNKIRSQLVLKLSPLKCKHLCLITWQKLEVVYMCVQILNSLHNYFSDTL